MSAPIPIPVRRSRTSASAIYVPVHRRTPSGTPPSPSSVRSTLSTPPPASILGVYTPAELLLLSTSPLATLSAGHVDALRALAPEVVQTHKQRKALAWHARHPTGSPSHARSSSRGSHTSESEEDRVGTWRHV